MTAKIFKIIGAGSLGLILAGRMLDKFSRVEIFESANGLGGITRDMFNSTGSNFFLGCQYLLASYLPTWAVNSENLLEFEHRYASLTEQNGKWNYKLDFAGPAFEIKEISQTSKIINDANFGDRLSLYPREISQILKMHVRKFLPVNLNLLHISSLSSLGITRVTTVSNDLELVRLKQSDSVIDELYGVSRNALGLKFETSYIPKFGYSKYWSDYVSNPSFKRNASIRYGRRVDKKSIGNEVMGEVKELKAWCADPRQLIQLNTSSRLDSMSYMVHAYGLSIESYSGPKLPFYINIFSSTNPLVRLFFYMINSEIKVSIDSLNKYDSAVELTNELVKFSSLANITLRVSNQEFAYARTRRYFPISKKDYEILKTSNSDLVKNNWLDTGTYLYDRKSRLELIFDQI